MRILIVGGSKSGKSGYAQKLANYFGKKKYYWACMEPYDEEDLRRIAAHVAARQGMNYSTIERARNISDEIPPEISGATVLFDSVTALLSNEMFVEGKIFHVEEKLIHDLLAVSKACENFICVGDYIFADSLEYDGITEEFRKELADIFIRLADEFDVVCEVVAGIPHFIKGKIK